jgi:hypothetical protein
MNTKSRFIPIGLAFVFGVGAGWIAKEKSLDFFFTTYFPAIVTLLAAYYGAKTAFDLQRSREIESEKNKDLVNGNLVIYKLGSMLNTLTAYQEQIINPVRNKPTAYLEMKPTLLLSKEDINLNIETLSFLLNTDDINLMGEIEIEGRRFRTALDAINERSIIHQREAQAVLDKAGFVNGRDYSFEQIEGMLGNRIYETLKQATDEMVRHVDASIITIQQVSAKLVAALKKEFPRSRVLTFSRPGKDRQ